MVADGLLEMIDCFKEKFLIYREYLLDYNERVNLTSITDESQILVKHFADSVAAANLIKKGAYVCDIGAGAGFPSIPLKIVRDDLRFVLFEAANKKVAFLKEIAEKLQLNDIKAEHLRAEDAGREAYRGEFDVAVVRAVAGTSALLEYAMPLLKIGGVLIAYKTDSDEELRGIDNALNELNARLKDKYDYFLPNTDIKRALLVFEKIGGTPAKYPRGGGKERSKPL